MHLINKPLFSADYMAGTVLDKPQNNYSRWPKSILQYSEVRTDLNNIHNI